MQAGSCACKHGAAPYVRVEGVYSSGPPDFLMLIVSHGSSVSVYPSFLPLWSTGATSFACGRGPIPAALCASSEYTGITGRQACSVDIHIFHVQQRALHRGMLPCTAAEKWATDTSRGGS